MFDTGVDIVHVQHPQALPMEVLERIQLTAKSRSVPVVWSLHDYYAACPCIQLVHRRRYRMPWYRSLRVTAMSLPKQKGVFLWTSGVAGSVSSSGQADEVVVPSLVAAKLDRELFGLESEPIAIEHGMSGSTRPAPKPTRARPRVIVLG